MQQLFFEVKMWKEKKTMNVRIAICKNLLSKCATLFYIVEYKPIASPINTETIPKQNPPSSLEIFLFCKPRA